VKPDKSKEQTLNHPDYTYTRSYRGKVRGVVLDWSGTVADAYVMAPAVVFVEVFAKYGVEISMTEARGPMGLRKDLHIKKLTEVPAIRDRWRDVHGNDPDQSDVDAMFKDFVPMQVAVLPRYAALLPGVVEMADRLQNGYGIKIGMSTGFTRIMVDVLLDLAKEQKFHPDCTVAGDEVVHGARPSPFMVYRNLDLLDVHPIQSVVKVDDTTSGVGEGLEAGCWAVGIARYSNYMEMETLEEADTLPEDEIERRVAHTRDLLWRTGAHYVIDEPIELLGVIDDINSRLARGESP